MFVRAALACLLLAVLTPDVSAHQPADDEAARRLLTAQSIQAATRGRLGVMGDAFSCTDARFISYRRSAAEPEIADQWYVASQLFADAALMAAPTAAQEDAACYLDKGFIFLDRLWDYTGAGYFPRANPVGTRVEASTRFGDDNAIGGLAFLQAAQATGDPSLAQRYVHAARREADFMLDSGVWDVTFGGGFWWNTGRGDSIEGKPAQTNALAALFFARLYTATGEDVYRDWALRTLLWLDTILYDPSRHLYRWSVAYQDLKARSGSTLSSRYFNYDQGIAIEAEVAAQRLDGDSNRLARARDIASALPPAFGSGDLGGYSLEAGVPQVYTSYAAWTSLGELALYDADGDMRWLDAARANSDSLARRLAGSDGSVALRSYVCRDRTAPGCEHADVPLVVDGTVDGAAQAWQQHLQTALATRLATAGQ